MESIDLKGISAGQLEELLKRKKEEERQAALAKRDAYEGIRDDVLSRIEEKVRCTHTDVTSMYDFVVKETLAFYDVMREYGQLRKDDQMSFKIKSDTFCIEVRSNKVKKFDERADVAAERLIEFLRKWAQESERGTDDLMYQIAMTLLERNRYGDLDYKSISKLYDYEDRFGSEEYSKIMQLFRESNVVKGTATNFYFYERTELGVWRKIEVSFNRM
ncbi:MAG: DUF3164 family protein [Dysgonamonadaceae bacterium]|jgi:hypothetical protein|nr:DUF3164 family protein [Dysgonamonadaceae bacterium]